MSSISFKLEAFEGPLDLLLHLISKHKLNIYDIEISLLLDQYLEYIDSIDEQDFDLAGDFLAMAAKLVYIKTCSLLPQPEEAEEMKKELEGSLIEYSVCKLAAENLRKLCVYGDVFVRPPEQLPVNKTFTGNMDKQKLADAYMGMSAKARKIKPLKAEQFSPIVSSRIVTVTSKIVFVLKKLYKTGECFMSELYQGVDDKSARVATFLAILELTKTGRIYLNEDNTILNFNRDLPRKHKKTDKSEAVSTDEEFDENIADEELNQEQNSEIAEISETVETDNLEPYTQDYEILVDSDIQPKYQEDYIESESSEDFEEEKHSEQFANEQKSSDNTCVELNSDVDIEEKSVVREKYALESRSTHHIMAVPVFSPFSVSEPVVEETTEVIKPPAETETVMIIPPLDIISERVETDNQKNDILINNEPDEIIPAKNVYFEKNRFSRKCRWGYPLSKGNCWRFGRERY